ncbi:hypothetical protein [Alistipes onderdonkii]|uniref:hypothetical protein n=1 Tax=Alistipes onderdonkii TaxID=328813 RepID=UPI00189C4DE7|nr:hypothetical protein [Alistipes onderdonkii]
MGNFWDNATKEFGKKTGKAVGNKLYGQYADDVRKRVAFSGSSNVTVTQPSVNYGAIEKAKQMTLECEYNLNLLNTILTIEFNAKDTEGIIKNLTFLTSSIDLWLKQSDKKKSLRAAMSQFKTGLAVLNAVNAEHPMLPYFTNKEQEWQSFIDKQRKLHMILYSTLAGLFIIGVLVIVIVANS